MNQITPRIVLGVLAAALAGCGTQIGTETESGPCEVASSAVLTDTTAVPDGFAEPVDTELATLTGSFVGTVTASPASEQEGVDPATVTGWPIGSAASLDLAPIGDVTLYDLEPVDTADGTAEEWGAVCADRWTVPVSVGLWMEGQLDEVGEGTLTVEAGGRRSFDFDLPLAQVVGPAAPGPDLAAHPDTHLRVNGAFVDGAWLGNVEWGVPQPDDFDESEPSDLPDGEYLGAFEVR